MKIFTNAVGLLAMASVPAVGQATASATEEPIAASVATVRQQYAASFASKTELYSGPEYVDYAVRYHERIGHQFFPTQEPRPGRVRYNGQEFVLPQFAFDVVRDQVVVRHPTSSLYLHLVAEKLQSFEIDGHRFVRVVADSSSSKALRTGFYEVLNEGRAQVLVRRSKRMQERIFQKQIDVEFIPTERSFLKKEGAYYLINSKGAALRVFANEKKQMQQYLQEHPLRFNKAETVASVLKLALYYNSLPLR